MAELREQENQLLAHAEYLDAGGDEVLTLRVVHFNGEFIAHLTVRGDTYGGDLIREIAEYTCHCWLSRGEKNALKAMHVCVTSTFARAT